MFFQVKCAHHNDNILTAFLYPEHNKTAMQIKSFTHNILTVQITFSHSFKHKHCITDHISLVKIDYRISQHSALSIKHELNISN